MSLKVAVTFRDADTTLVRQFPRLRGPSDIFTDGNCVRARIVKLYYEREIYIEACVTPRWR
jgi:hypothetical protein